MSMLTIEIEGVGRVQLDGSFRSLPPEEQERTVNEIIQQHRSANQPAQEDSARGLVEAGAGGFNEGLMDLVGTPGNILAAATAGEPHTPVQNIFGENALTSGIDAVLDAPRRGAHALGSTIGSENLKSSFDGLVQNIPAPVRDVAGISDDFTMFPQGPDTQTGRLVRRVGEELGAAALPAAGITAAATRRVPGMAAQAPRMRDAFLDPISRTPGRATVGEVAAATGAGVGANAANELFPDNRTAELYGQLLGGLTPATIAGMPTSMAIRGVNAVRRRMSPEHQQDVARDVVGGYLGEQMTTQARDNLAASQKVADQIEGFSPSLAEQTQSPSIVKLQSDLEGRMSGQDIDAAIGRRVANEDAVRRFAEREAPSAGAEVDEVMGAGLDRIGRLRDGITEREASVLRRQEDLASGMPSPDLAEQGAAFRQRVREAGGDEQTSFEMIARESGLNDPSFVVPFAQFRDDILGAYEKATRLKMKDGAQGMPPPPSLIARIKNAQDTQNFDALMEVRSDISGAIRQADRMPSTDDTYRRGLRAMKRAFDDALEKAVKTTNDPDIARRYEVFRNAYRERYVERFSQGATENVLARDSTGAFKTPDENVVQSYFKPGALSAARQFKSIFGGDSAANAALEAVALDGLRRAAVRDGVLDQRAFDRWTREHASVLNEFPQIAKKARDVGSANAALLDRQRVLAERSRSVENSLLAKALKRIDADTASPVDVIRQALDAESPRRMNQISGALRREPEARSALQRAVWDSFGDLPPGSIAEAIDRKRAHLAAAGMTPAHLSALKTIDAARVMMSSVPLPQGTANIPNSVDAFVRTFGIRPDMMANRLREIHTGRSEPAYVLTNVISNVLARKQKQYMDESFRLVLYDPQLAQQLASSLRSGQIDTRGAKRLQARFFAAGVTPFKEDDGSEDRMLEFDVTPR
jgi:hypothetical protein